MTEREAARAGEAIEILLAVDIADPKTLSTGDDHRKDGWVITGS